MEFIRSLLLISFLGITSISYSQNYSINYEGFYLKEDSLTTLPVKYKLLINKKNKRSLFFGKVIDNNISEEQLYVFYGMDKDTEYYYDFRNDVLSVKENFMGNEMLITDSKLYDWTLTKDSKLIGGLLCYKAFGRNKDKFNFDNKENKVFNVEVWFTPEINLKTGPSFYVGLPGLVVQATNLTTKSGYNLVSIDKIENVEINFPNELKEVTRINLYKKLNARMKRGRK